MGRFARKLARNVRQHEMHAGRKRERRDSKLISMLGARWQSAVRQFPQHRFYVAGILEAEADRVRKEGVKQVFAALKDGPQPLAGWFEIKPLQNGVYSESGELHIFGVDVGRGQIQSLKLNLSFTVTEWIPRLIATPREAGQRLIATPAEAIAEAREVLRNEAP